MQTLQKEKFQTAEVIGLRPSYESYERDKRAWISTHPEASPSEYEAAMRAIARLHGL